jgi:isoquinoline 1-oxidoreductase beta subunit
VTPLTRRDFFAVAATAAGGLLVGIERAGAAPSPAAAAPLTPFITIRPDGRIEIFSPKPDVGTGTLTSLPMLIAEELDADWSSITVRQADIDAHAYGDQGVGGSDSILSSFVPLRRAGAIARHLLVQAAAARWSVPAADCRTAASRVVNSRNGASFSYGELAADAAHMVVPDEPPPLKDPRDWQILGSRHLGPATRDIVTGTAIYGIDVTLPGLLHAAIARCPVHGGRVRSFDASAAAQLPGVRAIFAVDAAREHIWMRSGVAVVADTTDAALRARDAVVIDWDTADAAAETDAAVFARCASASVDAARQIRASGDVDAAFAGAAAAIDADYELPFLPHLTMEPMNATARWTGSHCEVWGPIQLPEKAKAVVSSVMGVPPEAITIHVTRIGGGFGRRLLSDYAAEAAFVARRAGAPVKVTWSREDDITQDYYRPASRHRVRVGVSAGRIVAWDHHVAGTPNDAYPGDVECDGLLAPRTADARADLNDGLRPCLVPNYRLRATTIRSAIPTGSLRAPAHNSNAFVVESAIDEAAHTARVDPVALRLSMLGTADDFPIGGPRRAWTYDPARLRRVVETAARVCGWSGPLATGQGRGIAAHFAMSSYAAHVIEVSVEERTRLRIRRIVVVVDCGRVMNPSGVDAQATGATLDALAAALFGGIHVENGRTAQTNFDGCRLLRNLEAPPIEVHVIASEFDPTGMGEPPYPTVAPALANAIFSATGQRVRRLPIADTRFALA